ncbi:hypothetical protein GDO81_008691 [Engystomops pustulosus]|uniref:Uncharacterized protein n=1 Tax=Engystomops pustulosus TaxID=76066 RepID=A0AAV7CGF0_ENGPU|nr:hypothetical protein GDO81_008691 [Engystomops pustulosus]
MTVHEASKLQGQNPDPFFLLFLCDWGQFVYISGKGKGQRGAEPFTGPWGEEGAPHCTQNINPITATLYFIYCNKQFHFHVMSKFYQFPVSIDY